MSVLPKIQILSARFNGKLFPLPNSIRRACLGKTGHLNLKRPKLFYFEAAGAGLDDAEKDDALNWAFSRLEKRQYYNTTDSLSNLKYSNGQSLVRFNSPDLLLSPNHQITNVPRKRSYTFVVTNQTAAPDGFQRTMLVINNQSPGPLIEANEGDTIEVNVINRSGHPMTFHWHGLHQKGTPWMDGISGVTQCPIPPNANFTYLFTIRDQFGTFWYHAHTFNLKADGLIGPLIVHSVRDPLVRGVHFEQDQILFISDWFHNTSTLIMGEMLSPSGYNGSFAAPSPNSALLNGVGFFDCEKYAPNEPCVTRHELLEITVKPKSRTRIRLINSGSRTLFKVSVDNHLLEVIEADATPVISRTPIQRLQIHNGERYSIIIDSHSDNEGDSFFLRAAIDTDCLSWLAPGIDTVEGNTARLIVRVSNDMNYAGGSSYKALPSSRDWNSSTGGECFDLDGTILTPRIKPRYLNTVKGRVFFNTSFGTRVAALGNTSSVQNIVGRFFVDQTTYISRPQAPLLQDMLKGGRGSLNTSEVATEVLPEAGIWDIVVNNLDQALDHPFHLHGLDTCLVARGNGTLNETFAKNLRYNTQTPLCKDVHVLPGGTFSVFRVVANNPGVWFWHCHMGWHLGAGFAAVIVLQPAELAQWQLPVPNQALCVGNVSSSSMSQ
ncbi:hypothetical protein O181_040930 [Austropuccinia psidii MF-1]|uniref:Laccase n=1 Tax=Austropuccinia psidii MF-1 TaxID=1389203 RepID=A0A9Q3DHR9_9BASI|nr:hypothetical protein [Austropuccinia psidii MF-1]